MVLGDPAEQRQAVQRALDAGITYFDTAASYGDGRSEENLGRVLGELGAWQRVVVGTKVRVPNLEQQPRAAIRASLEASLKRLGHDDVDVFHLHNPLGGEQLDAVLGEVARGFEDVIQAGLVRHAGFTGLGETAALIKVLRTDPYETVQTFFNALNPSAGYPGASGGQQDFGGMIDTAASAGRGVIVIRVLAAGAASAQLERATNAGDPGGVMAGSAGYAADVERARRLTALAGELGLESSLELAVRFGLSKPGVSTVLVGYSNIGHLEDAIRWAERGPLADDAVQRVVGLAG
jgi:aryl-alcohol dehydrogenase-like predicted oxidoreductase